MLKVYTSRAVLFRRDSVQVHRYKYYAEDTQPAHLNDSVEYGKLVFCCHAEGCQHTFQHLLSPHVRKHDSSRTSLTRTTGFKSLSETGDPLCRTVGGHPCFANTYRNTEHTLYTCNCQTETCNQAINDGSMSGPLRMWISEGLWEAIGDKAWVTLQPSGTDH